MQDDNICHAGIRWDIPEEFLQRLHATRRRTNSDNDEVIRVGSI
jgi:hypothetical protein